MDGIQAFSKQNVDILPPPQRMPSLTPNAFYQVPPYADLPRDRTEAPENNHVRVSPRVPGLDTLGGVGSPLTTALSFSLGTVLLGVVSNAVYLIVCRQQTKTHCGGRRVGWGATS